MKINKRNSTKLTDYQINQLIEYYCAGFGSVTVAKKLGISKSVVLNYLKKNGIERRKTEKKFNEKEIDNLCKEYSSGIGIGVLGNNHRCSSSTIWRYLKQRKIGFRNSSD